MIDIEVRPQLLTTCSHSVRTADRSYIQRERVNNRGIFSVARTEIITARARQREISSYRTPRTLEQVFLRGKECLKELQTFSSGFPHIVGSDAHRNLNDLEKALEHLESVEKRASGKGDNGNGPPPPHNDPSLPPKKSSGQEDSEGWISKLIRAVKKFCDNVASVALSMGKAMAAATVRVAKAVIPPAWNAFWTGVGMAVGSIIKSFFVDNLGDSFA